MNPGQGSSPKEQSASASTFRGKRISIVSARSYGYVSRRGGFGCKRYVLPLIGFREAAPWRFTCATHLNSPTRQNGVRVFLFKNPTVLPFLDAVQSTLSMKGSRWRRTLPDKTLIFLSFAIIWRSPATVADSACVFASYRTKRLYVSMLVELS